MKKMLGALVVVLLVSGCFGNRPETQASGIHRNFSVEVVDSKKMPVENAEVYVVIENKTVIKLVSNAAGIAKINDINWSYYSFFAEKKGYFPSVGEGGSSENEIKVTAELGGPFDKPELVYYLPQGIINITPGQKSMFPVELISHNGFEGFIDLSEDKNFPKEFQAGMESNGFRVSKGETRTVDFYINAPPDYEFLSNTISGDILLNVNDTPNTTVPVRVMGVNHGK
jgi:hypothetical protein